jgi:hypothetical protein
MIQSRSAAEWFLINQLPAHMSFTGRPSGVLINHDSRADDRLCSTHV